MYVFIWENVQNLTHRYHDEGGLVIVAKELAEARAMYLANDGQANCAVLTEPPTRIIACVAQEKPVVFIFQDAGCC